MCIRDRQIRSRQLPAEASKRGEMSLLRAFRVGQSVTADGVSQAGAAKSPGLLVRLGIRARRDVRRHGGPAKSVSGSARATNGPQRVLPWRVNRPAES